ncbi:MAG: DnaJ C-terminal domain-containing protein [Flavimaricola sp.]|nr:DnaJ C-terminal domain-containing protein [Flavimaricola sp.]
MSDNPYTTLGLTKAATEAEIKAAYRKLVRASHPDLHPDDAGAEARFKAISAAYDLLKDPETRGQFDRGEIDASGAPRQERQFYRDYAGAADNPYRGGPRFDGDDDAADIFASFFRQREQRAGQQGFSARGNDRRYSLEVAFLDAVNGGKTRIVLPGGGALEVAIPPGVSDGQTIRLRGKGDPGFEGGPPGDALVTLSVQPHMTFQRQGNDIHIVLPVPLDVAILGGKVAVPTISGQVQMSIPPGSSCGRVLRLKGKGVHPSRGPGGDQLAEVRIILPDPIDPDLTAAIEGWQAKRAKTTGKGGQS